MKFTEWLRKEMNGRSWTVRELARRAEISHASVSKVMNGKQNPTDEFCKAIAKALGEREDYVLWLAGVISKPIKPDEPFVYEIADVARQLTPEQREHVIAIMRMIKDGSLSVYNHKK